ncbi:hypothetical protein [Longimicrobium sp.]|uniref:hypothetical protein n=1 Tax=Longimicrobium sp. TaxID=2029185 RepID=UPI002D7F4F64|nr:hypothetical protein [Longimicrobium sp.]
MTIRGDFADSARVPATVFAVEAEREAEVKRGAFVLRGLSAGPVTLRLVSGTDTVGVLALNSLPGGTTLELRRLRVDDATHLAFPQTVSLTGPDLVTLNGVRMAVDARIPAEVDAHGRVLSIAPEHDALILRPDDSALPDLRVVVGFAAQAVTPDGDPVEPGRIAAGDSIRVQGRSDHGFVVATKLIVPRRRAAAAPPAAEPAPVAQRPPPRSSQPGEVEVHVRVPNEVQEVINAIQGRGNGRARGHAKDQGKGNGHGRG